MYHHALHDRYYVARDKLLMSHIQDNIDKVDTKTMILYNRALVTIGLSAFREGLVQKVRARPVPEHFEFSQYLTLFLSPLLQAHDCLTGTCSGRVRELLAQGQARWPEKDPEQEKVTHTAASAPLTSIECRRVIPH